MSVEPKPQVLRLQKRHEPDPEGTPDLAIGQRLSDVQSLTRASIAGLLAIAGFCLLWSLLSLALGRFFPWLSLLLGVFVGFAIRRAGLGLDWRFPLLAAVMTAAGALLGIGLVAAVFTAEASERSTLSVLGLLFSPQGLSSLLDELTSIDTIYAVSAAAIAAFYSVRRLSRRQYLAWRLWRQARSAD